MLKRNEKIITNKSIFIILILILSYIFFQGTFQSVSQILFSWYYDFSIAETRNSPKIIEKIIVNKEILYPVLPIAHPPQTPYGFILAKFPIEVNSNVIIPQYVFTRNSNPVGYIEKTNGSLYLITLFSSKLSKEKFSISNIISDGVGIGGGAIRFEIPIGKEINIGDPVVHLGTGGTSGYVVEIIENLNSNTQEIRASLSSNPLEIDAYYLKKDISKKVSDEDIEQILKNIDSKLKESNDKKLKEEGEENKNDIDKESNDKKLKESNDKKLKEEGEENKNDIDAVEPNDFFKEETN